MEYERGFIEATDGTRLFFEDSGGDGPAIVLNDGIGCDGFAWAYLRPALEKDYRILHWHYRGHGRSGAPVDASQITIADLARDLTTVLDARNVSSAVLVCHSMGTQVALETYRRYRDRVRAMVLMCGSYGRITETFHGTDFLHHALPKMLDGLDRFAGAGRALWGTLSPKAAYQLAKLSGEVDGARLSARDFERYWEHVTLMEPSLFLRMLKAAGEHTAEDILSDIDVPTLIVAAERDRFTPVEIADAMAERIPDAGYLFLPGASHAGPVEQADLVNQHVASFLSELG